MKNAKIDINYPTRTVAGWVGYVTKALKRGDLAAVAAKLAEHVLVVPSVAGQTGQRRLFAAVPAEKRAEVYALLKGVLYTRADIAKASERLTYAFKWTLVFADEPAAAPVAQAEKPKVDVEVAGATLAVWVFDKRTDVGYRQSLFEAIRPDQRFEIFKAMMSHLPVDKIGEARRILREDFGWFGGGQKKHERPLTAFERFVMANA